jgi:glyoxylase-like metal-dependent hydrolase (beta-lactamase superfamily II)
MAQLPFHFHRIPVGIDNCYLLCGRKNILIDGGAPGHFDGFVNGIKQAGVDPKSVELIILTHGHADHIGSLNEIQEQSGARIAIHKHDQGWVGSGQPALPPGVTTWGRTLIFLANIFYKPKIVPCRVDFALDNEDFPLEEFGIPGRVIHMPGHSMGSVCVLLDTGEAFTGDMAMNTWFLRATPGLPVLAQDMNLVIASWKKLMVLGAKRVYPAHGKDFPIEVIQKEILKIERGKGGKYYR